MAYGSGYMGDATSGIGQGLAYVIPEGGAAKYAMNLAQEHASQLQQLVKQKQALAIKAQEQYQNDFKDQKLPQAFAPFDKELNTRFNSWIQKGAKQYATTGKNPYNDPEFMAQYNTDVLTPARKSQELGANYTKLRAIAETDPGNKYTKDSKQAVIDYQKQMESDPFSTLDKPLPQLVETPATVDDLVKTLKATSTKSDDGTWETKGPDSSAHKAQAFAALLGDEKWHPLLKKYGYNPDLPDFGVYTDPKHPNGKRVWYTNETFTGHQADDILSAPDDPRNARILQTLGIDPANDQNAKYKLQHAIADQNAAMGSAVTDVAGRKDAEVPTERDRKYADANFGLAQARLGIAEERLQLSKDKEAKKAQETDSLIEKMRTGEHGSGEELAAHFATNPSYGKPLAIRANPKKPDEIAIDVPAKVKANPNYNPDLPPSNINAPTIQVQKPYTIQLNKQNVADFHAKLAYLLKESGGDKKLDKESKRLNQPSGIPPAKKTIKQSDIAAKAAVAGYTTKEYTELLKQKGIKIE